MVFLLFVIKRAGQNWPNPRARFLDEKSDVTDSRLQINLECNFSIVADFITN